MTDKIKIQPHWWTKSILGCVLGFTLALALSALLTLMTPGGLAGAGKLQFTMWMVAPFWMLVFSLTYLYRSGLRAFIWLLALNSVSYSLLYLMLR
jgi:hypothetical protein